MINDIINGVAAAIREEFGENVKIYAGQVSGSLEKPFFFVLSDGGGLELYRGKRYYAKNRIIVNFMAEGEGNDGAYEIGQTSERLFKCLEVINISEGSVRAKNMNCGVSGGELKFTCEYNMFLYKIEDAESMEELEQKTEAD